MADVLTSALPVRTATNGDVVAFLADGTVNTQLLGIDASGRITIKLTDGTGNSVTSQVNGAQRALDVGINVAGVQIDPRAIRALTAADIVTVAAITAALPAGANNIGSVNQGTSPWIVKDQGDGPVTPGTVASFSMLIGGQYNTTLPTLTTGQQAAIQVDSSGRLLVATVSGQDTNYGTVGVNTQRSAAQIGNATGAADFNAGATGAQTLRTVANQGAANTIANAWPQKITDGTNTAAVKAASTAAAATDPALVVGLSPNSPLPAGTNLLGATNVFSGGTAVSNTNPLFVTVTNATPGTPVMYYNATSNIALAATDSTSSYTVTTGKTFSVKKVFVSSSIRVRADFQISLNGTVFTTIATMFTSTAGGNQAFDLDEIAVNVTGTGSLARVVFTNDDVKIASAYASILGSEN